MWEDIGGTMSDPYEEPAEKVCFECNQTLPISEFYSNGRNRVPRCRECHKAWRKRSGHIGFGDGPGYSGGYDTTPEMPLAERMKIQAEICKGLLNRYSLTREQVHAWTMRRISRLP